MPKRRGPQPATLAEVAAAVGLSPAAVSLALRGKGGVSEATRARVVEAARALGYRPVAGASRQHQEADDDRPGDQPGSRRHPGGEPLLRPGDGRHRERAAEASTWT